MKISTARRYRRSHRFWRDLITNNPALVVGVDLPFVIVCANGLKNAVALSIMMFMIHMVTMTVAKTVSIKLPLWLRSMVNVTVSTIMMLISREVVILMFPNITNLVGMYLYLMAVNGLTLMQANSRRGASRLPQVLARALIDVAAFAGIMLFTSFVREYLGNGSLWGLPVPVPFKQPGILYPFFGFIFTGYLLAFLRFINKAMVASGVNTAERVENAYKDIKLKPEPYKN